VKVDAPVVRRDVKVDAPLVSYGARRGSHGALSGTFCDVPHVPMKHRKLTPAERVIYNYGHFDGERGLAPRSAQFTERQREIYNHAYGKGTDLRYRARENVRRHANKITDVGSKRR
jgi:hypothetical protein